MVLFPFVPIIFRFFTKKTDRYSEIALVSSSGLAHYFPVNANLKVLYLNTPTRWIWKKTDFEKSQSITIKVICNVLRPIYRYLDKRNIRKFDIVASNSANIQRQIKNIYDIDSQIVYPPVKKNGGGKSAARETIVK